MRISVGELVKALMRASIATQRSCFAATTAFISAKTHWRKFALWEEATRVPLIVVPAAGAMALGCWLAASLIDISPTILKAAGVDPGPRHRRRRSLARVGGGLCGHTPSVVDLKEITAPQRAGRYTIIAPAAQNSSIMHVIPGEWTNLADDPAYADVCRAMSQIDSRRSGDRENGGLSAPASCRSRAVTEFRRAAGRRPTLTGQSPMQSRCEICAARHVASDTGARATFSMLPETSN